MYLLKNIENVYFYIPICKSESQKYRWFFSLLVFPGEVVRHALRGDQGAWGWTSWTAAGKRGPTAARDTWGVRLTER